MVQLERIEVENFKSYKGKQIIGPFSPFTAIIGPNGKSNLMDAISFVLGVQTSQLRSTQLKDLIYRPPKLSTSSSSSQIIKNASAALILSTDEEQFTFKRSITASGGSEYSLNNKVISFQEYTKQLAKFNILTKARNFLVFQGDVETIASQSPFELTKLVETMSGSGELKYQYDQLKQQEQIASEKSNSSFLKKRAVASELRSVVAQKKELDEYNTKKAKLTSLVSEYMLAKLYKIDSDLSKTQNDILSYNEKLISLSDSVKSAESSVLSQRKSHAKAFKDLSKADRQVKLVQLSLEEKQLISTEKKKSSVSLSIEKLSRDISRQQSVVSTVESELASLNRAKERNQDAWENSPEAQRFKDSALESEMLAGYQKIKLAIDSEGQADSIKQREISENLNALESKIKKAESKKEEILKSLKEKNERILSEKDQLSLDQMSLNDAVAQNNSISEKIKSTSSQRETLLSKEFELNEKLSLTLKQITQVRALELESKKEKRNAEILLVLKRLFQNVYGRVSELCRPIQRKYELAASLTLGKFSDAIVVENQQTAIDCIRYLREQRAGTATFLPLDNLLVPTISESARKAHPNARLVVDILEYNAKYERAISFVCGSNIVCDTLEVARDVCYTQNIQVKAITIDGTIIHKSGNITGGSFTESGSVSSNLAKWERGSVQKLLKVRDELSLALTEISKTKGSLTSVESLQTMLMESETNISSLHNNVERTKRRLATTSAEIQDLQKQQQNLEDEINNLENQVENLELEYDQITEKINTASEPLFRDFCAKFMFSSISEFESIRKAKNRAERTKTEFINQISRLDNQLQFEKEHLESMNLDLERSNQLLNQTNSSMISIQTSIRLLENEVSELLAKLESAKQEFLSRQGAYHESTAALNKLVSEYTEASSNLELVNRMKSSKETELSKFIDNKLVILRKCRLESVEIPFVSGSLSQVPMSFVNMSSISGSSEKESYNNFVINELKINYSELPLQSRAGSGQREETQESEDSTEGIEKSYEKRIAILKTEIATMTPSAYAREKYDLLQRRLEETDSEFMNSRRSAKEVYMRFSAVKQKRLELFNGMFQHISANIDKFYKILTKSPAFPIGGTAYLNLENTEEPYLGGIKYHAMPPLKRFRDMDHLSGGEKTVAALALLFTLQSYIPSPFFVLDEVDAALDLANVVQLANYLKLRSTQQAISVHQASASASKTTSNADNFQFIVISLKQKLFERANSLVGVYRDQNENASNTLNLDLTSLSV
ncbi:hypothetical protein BB560_006965 [Smittium megazygosporum]|uniref:Structural maintenance of chromosomes protein n=1 Tax=Smittium megazygosporum TaxID=133381 RepID=A0A2T9XZV1_9FUNG|nr:hypothetical protein BB560_006965 [Smittium megazygosporum]